MEKIWNHRKEWQELSQLQSADLVPLPEFDATIKISIWKI